MCFFFKDMNRFCEDVEQLCEFFFVSAFEVTKFHSIVEGFFPLKEKEAVKMMIFIRFGEAIRTEFQASGEIMKTWKKIEVFGFWWTVVLVKKIEVA